MSVLPTILPSQPMIGQIAKRGTVSSVEINTETWGRISHVVLGTEPGHRA
jgi:hypothetical protein